MPDEAKLHLQKKYHRLIDLASDWKLSVPELINYAIEGVLQVAIEEFRGSDDSADRTEGLDVEEGGDQDAYPQWAVFLVPDVLKKLAVDGKAYVAGGFRMTQGRLRPTFFPQRRLTTADLIVLPQSLSHVANPVDAGVNAIEPPLSQASKDTLLKQIAALAILLSKQQEKFAWGTKPNSSAIAKAIEQALAIWPASTHGVLDKSFFSKSKINDSIREGLKLIGFKDDKDSM